jgi:uncharacterized protein (UPF0548 family)
MFLVHRPSSAEIARFLDDSRHLPLSYEPAGIAGQAPDGRTRDELIATVGRGLADFERARAALIAWKHFQLGWLELFPNQASVEAGTVVAVLIRHLGFWSLNGARVLYHVGGPGGQTAFGFAYGTLTNHAESGEELFEVFVDGESREVSYRIRAVSRPRAALARLGYPITRVLQARFRQDSAAAMWRAVSAGE